MRQQIRRVGLLLALAGLSSVALPSSVAATTVNSLSLQATYDVSASFSWSTRSVVVATTAQVSNPTGSSVGQLAFNLAPLRIGKAHLGAVKVNGQPAQAGVEDQTILVTLPSPLAPGASKTVDIAYTARLSSRSGGDRWQFARLSGVMTAYRWIPWLSRTVKFDRPSVGEPWVTPTSKLVRVAITTDRPLIFATSGRRVAVNGLTQTFIATNVRDFNFSASPYYQAKSRTVLGTRITVYYRSQPATEILDWAERAFRDYSAKVGPYPYPQFTIGEVGPWAAIESPSLVWIPSNLPARLRSWSVTHEIAHQWFYSVVGNDQASEPFADEALSDFMSRNLISRFVNSKCAPDDLDQSIYDLGSCYPWVIYVQGNQYLRAYRDQVGNTRFWRGVANYYAVYRHRIGGTRQLLDMLDAAAGISYPHYKRFPSLYP